VGQRGGECSCEISRYLSFWGECAALLQKQVLESMWELELLLEEKVSEEEEEEKHREEVDV